MPATSHSQTHRPIDFESDRKWLWNRVPYSIERLQVVFDAGQGRSPKRALAAPSIVYTPGRDAVSGPNRLTLQYSRQYGSLIIRSINLYDVTPKIDEFYGDLLRLDLPEWHTVLFSYRFRKAADQDLTNVSLTKERLVRWMQR